MKFIFTKANADAHGRIINKMIDDYVASNDHAVAFASLGVSRYLSALKHSEMIIGNSSSGIIEAQALASLRLTLVIVKGECRQQV